MIKNMGRDKISALAKILQLDPVELVPADGGNLQHRPLYNRPEDIERLEALHQDPEKGILFDRVKNMPHEDFQKLMQMIDIMFPKESD